MPEVVRLAGPPDEDALLDLYITLHREGMGRAYPYSYPKVMAGIQKATRGQGGIAGVIDAPRQTGRLAAVIFLYVDQWWWSDCSFLQMRECYVRREYRRGTRYFGLLREFAEGIRKSMNDARPEGHPPVLLEMSFIEADPARERLMDRLWRRWGQRIGGIYLSGLQ